jgi:cbb3-type cytochrome oxidase subunit 3
MISLLFLGVIIFVIILVGGLVWAVREDEKNKVDD